MSTEESIVLGGIRERRERYGDDVLRIGDSVLYVSGEGGGFLGGDGFYSLRTYIQSQEDGDKLPRDIFASVFRVYSTNQYVALKTMKKHLRRAGAGDVNRILDSSVASVEQILDQIQPRMVKEIESQLPRGRTLADMIEEIIQERESNDEEFRRSQGRPVQYGQTVQLQHIKSNRFLTLRKREHADEQKDALKLTLDRAGSEGSWFAFMPGFKARSEGEAVRVGDLVSVMNIKSRHFVHESSLRYSDGRCEVNGSTRRSRWLLRRYESHAETALSVARAGQPVRLFHREVEGRLAFRPAPPHDVGAVASLRVANAPDAALPGALVVQRDRIGPDGSSGARSGGSSDASEVLSSSDAAQRAAYASFELWELELADPITGGAIQWEKSYRLRHTATGGFLALHKSRSRPDAAPVLYVASHRDEIDTLFDLVALDRSNSSGAVTMDAYFRLQHRTSGMWIGAFSSQLEDGVADTSGASADGGSDDGESENSAANSGGFDNAEAPAAKKQAAPRSAPSLRFPSLRSRGAGKNEPATETRPAPQSVVPADGTTSPTRARALRCPVEATREMRQEDAFSFGAATTREADDLRFVLTHKRVLVRFYKILDAFRDPSSRSIAGRACVHMRRVLANLILFCTLSSDPNPLTREGRIIAQAQALLAEQGIVDAVMHILREPFTETQGSGVLSLGDLRRHEFAPLFEVCRLCYRLLRHIARGNPASSPVFIPHIRLLQHHTKHGLGAAETLLSLFKDNRQLLRRLADADIDFFVDIISASGRQPEYVDYLSALCVCDGVAVFENQQRVGKRLFDRERLFLPILSERDGAVQVSLGGDMVPLHVFCTKATAAERDYFERVLLLLSQLCVGRNYDMIERVERVVSFHMALSCVTNEALPAALRSAFGRLFLHAHVDRDPHEASAGVMLTRLWPGALDGAAAREELQRRRHDQRMTEAAPLLRSFATKHLEEHVNSFGRKPTLEALRLTGTVLALLHAMVRFGYVAEATHLHRIAPLLVDLLADRLHNAGGDDDALGGSGATMRSRRTMSLSKRMHSFMPARGMSFRASSDGGGAAPNTPVRGSVRARSRSATWTERKETQRLMSDPRFVESLVESKRTVCDILSDMYDAQLSLRMERLLSHFYSIYTDREAAARAATTARGQNEDAARESMRNSTRQSGAIGDGTPDRNAWRHAVADTVHAGLLEQWSLFPPEDTADGNNGEEEAEEEEEEREPSSMDAAANPNASTGFQSAHATSGATGQSAGGSRKTRAPQIVQVYLSLFQSGNAALSRSSLKLLLRHYAQRQESIEALRRVQLLVDDDNVRAAVELRDLLATMKDILEDGVIDMGEIARLASTMSEVAAVLCPRLARQPSALRQNMMRHMGIADVLSRTLQVRSTGADNDEMLAQRIFRPCFELMAMLAYHCPENQEIMLRLVPIVLSHCGRGLGAEEALTAIYHGNRHANQMPDSLLERFAVFARAQRRPEYMRFLAAVVVDGANGLSELQERVMNLLLRYRDALPLFSGSEGTARLLELAKRATGSNAQSSDTSDAARELEYHIAFVELLFALTLGINEVTETKCQALVSGADTLAVLRTDVPAFSLKRAYAMFLNESYVNIDLSLLATDPALLREVWELLPVWTNEVRRFAPARGDARIRANDPELGYLTEGLFPLLENFLRNNFVIDTTGSDEGIAALRTASDFAAAVCSLHDMAMLPQRARDAARGTLLVLADLGIPSSDHGPLNRFLEKHSGGKHGSVLLLGGGGGSASGNGSANGSGGERSLFRPPSVRIGAGGLLSELALSAGGDDNDGSGSGSDSKAGARVADRLRRLRVEVVERAFRAFCDAVAVALCPENESASLAALMRAHASRSLLGTLGLFLRNRLLREEVSLKEFCVRALSGAIEDAEDMESTQERIARLGGVEICTSLTQEREQRVVQASLQLGIAMLEGGHEVVQGLFYQHWQERSAQSFFRTMRHQLRQLRARLEQIDAAYDQQAWAISSRMRRRTAERKSSSADVLRRAASGAASTVGSRRKQASSVFSPFKRLSGSSGAGATERQMSSSDARPLLASENSAASGFGESFVSVDPKARESSGDIEMMASESAEERMDRQRFFGEMLPVVEYGIALLRFLQLLCEGHNTKMQNFLRVQDTLVETHDLLSDILALLNALVRSSLVSEATVGLVVQTCATLTEMAQGPCRENQAALIQNKGALTLNAVLRGDFGLQPSSTVALLDAALELLLSLFEGALPGSLAPKLVLQELNPGAVMDVMDRAAWSALPGSDMVGFKCYALLHHIGEGAGPPGLRVLKRLHERQSFEHFSRIAGSIEVARGRNIERVFFPIPDVCENLRDQSKEDLLWAVNRMTPKESLTDFLFRADTLVHEMEYRDRMSKRPAYAFLTRHAMRWRNWSVVCSAIIVFVTFFIEAPEDLAALHGSIIANNTTRPERSDIYDDIRGEWDCYTCDLKNVLLLIFGVLQVIFCALMGLEFIVSSIPLLQHQYRIDTARREELAKSQAAFRFASGKEDQLKATRLAEFVYLGRNFLIWYHIGVVVCAVLGLVENPFFYSFNLLEVIVRSKDLRNVIFAVTKNGKQLGLTIILLLVVIYYFTIFGFLYYRDLYVIDDSIFDCDNMFMCFISSISYGLRSSGGLGDHLLPVDFGRLGYASALSLSVFNIVFFFIVVVIFLNLVLGIIIDTFAQLRARNQSISDDMRNRCFICWIQRSKFDDLKPDGFEIHIKHEHSMWHYLFFFVYLRQKDKTEYTGLESYVDECVERRDVSFFPLHASKALLESSLLDDEVKVEDVRDEIVDMSRSQNAALGAISGKLESLAGTVAGLQAKLHAFERGEVSPRTTSAHLSRDSIPSPSPQPRAVPAQRTDRGTAPAPAPAPAERDTAGAGRFYRPAGVSAPVPPRSLPPRPRAPEQRPSRPPSADEQSAASTESDSGSAAGTASWWADLLS